MYLEVSSVYAKGLIENLLSVHGLANMARASGEPEYMETAQNWMPRLEEQLANLKAMLAHDIRRLKEEKAGGLHPRDE